MAAHDTLASSLSSFVYFLAINPCWQGKLREEAQALGLARGEPLPYERLDDLPLTEMAFKKSLRLIPPVPSIPRCAVRDTEFAGFRIPKGARVNVNPLYTHHMPDVWPEPEKFDPLRFTDEATRARHKYAFVPMAEARTCASACILRICRRNASPIICLRFQTFQPHRTIGRAGNTGRSRSRATDCR